MIPCLRCISSRGQNTHLALQMFVLSIWTISGRMGDRSRPSSEHQAAHRLRLLAEDALGQFACAASDVQR